MKNRLRAIIVVVLVVVLGLIYNNNQELKKTLNEIEATQTAGSTIQKTLPQRNPGTGDSINSGEQELSGDTTGEFELPVSASEDSSLTPLSTSAQ